MSHTSCELNIDISFNDALLWLKISCSRAFLNSTAFTHTHIHTYSHTHISTYTHIHIHVHIHTHTHIYTYRFKLKQTMRYLTFAFAIQGARFEAQAEAHGSKNDISHFWSRSKVKHKIIFIHSSYMGLSDSLLGRTRTAGLPKSHQTELPDIDSPTFSMSQRSG